MPKKVKKTEPIKVEVKLPEEERKPIKLLANQLDKIILTPKQQELVNKLYKNTIVTITGPAGTSKTFVSCYFAIQSYMKHKFEKIILIKPIHEAGEELGFLPGDVNEKIEPHYESFTNNFIKLIGKETYQKLIKAEVILCKPLAYLRGASFENSLMLLDEAQNCSMKQLMLAITRLGVNSKIVISGDIRQYDIAKNNVALPFLIDNVLSDITHIDHFEFTDDDNMRHNILIEITKRYEILKENNDIPKHF